MPDRDRTQTFISASVTFRNTPTDCFFTLDCGVNWCPGWAIADIILPLAVHANQYILVWDSTGVAYWIAKHKIHFRGEFYKFDFDCYQKFDWNKWQQFPPIVPRAGND